MANRQLERFAPLVQDDARTERDFTSTAAATSHAITRDARLGPGLRVMHLVDLENLLGTPRFNLREAEAMAARYSETSELASHDHLVIATSHFAARVAWTAFPVARRLVGSGPDGADIELLKVVARESIPQRFDRIVLASGDGIFAEPMARLQAAGVSVSVVSRRDALSRRLRLSVRDVRYVDIDSPSSAPCVERPQAQFVVCKSLPIKLAS
jgi:hypothetical protein